MKKRRTYEIALGAICTALILLLLWLSVLLRFGTAAFYIVCSGVLMVPLTKKYYVASILSYIASSLLAFAVVGDIFSILGFVAYFGPITILSVFLFEKNIKLYFTLPLKIVLINAALAVFYFVTDTFFINFDMLGFKMHYIFIALIGTALLVGLDFAMLYIYKELKPKVARLIRDDR